MHTIAPPSGTTLSLAAPARSTRRWFAPFLVLATAQVIAIALGWDVVVTGLRVVTLPALAVALLATSARPWSLGTRLVAISLVAAAIGRLLFPVSVNVGPAVLVVAQFLVIAVTIGVFRRDVKYWAFGYVLADAALMVLIVPIAGDLLVPLFAFGLVVTVAAFALTRGNALTAISGVLLFVACGLLTIALFGASFSIDPVALAVVINASYLASQLLLVLGLRRFEAVPAAERAEDELTPGDGAWSREEYRRDHTDR